LVFGSLPFALARAEAPHHLPHFCFVDEAIAVGVDAIEVVFDPLRTLLRFFLGNLAIAVGVGLLNAIANFVQSAGWGGWRSARRAWTAWSRLTFARSRWHGRA